MPAGRTRLAPSPTGALHLGNARTFFINWLLARQNDWSITLRIEDLDGPRIKKDAAQQAIDDLQWLGLDWDDGPVYQSSRSDLYNKALEQLKSDGRVYPCTCSRSEVELAASAPHIEDGSTIYPGTCRGRFINIQEALSSTGRKPALRFNTTRASTIEFEDGFQGLIRCHVAQELGDFVVAKQDGTPAYQLAAAVDDAAMHMTHVVRGDDLISSTPRQILLYKALGLEKLIPSYIHIPLVVGPDGKRLAKRHGDTKLSTYRHMGVPASSILRLLAHWCGMNSENTQVAADCIGCFDLQKLGHMPVVMHHHDDEMLRKTRNTTIGLFDKYDKQPNRHKEKP